MRGEVVQVVVDYVVVPVHGVDLIEVDEEQPDLRKRVARLFR